MILIKIDAKYTFNVKCHFNEKFGKKFTLEIDYDGYTYRGTIKEYNEKDNIYIKIGSIGFGGIKREGKVLQYAHAYMFIQKYYEKYLELTDFFNKKLNFIQKIIFGL